MAKINNQAVIQKLIDELRLYPGTDLIPTELAEKILPVFQINDTAINFVEGGELKLFRDETLNSNDRTILVPVGKVWEIEFISFDYITTATINTRNMRFEILDSDGNIIFSAESLRAVPVSNVKEIFMFYENAGDKNTNLFDTDQGFQNIRIPKLKLLAGFGIRFFDASDRDTNDDMVSNVMVRERDEV